MDITITIKAPELAGAIKALAESIGWYTATANKPAEITIDGAKLVEQAVASAQRTPRPEAVPEQMELAPPEAAKTISMDDAKKRVAEIVKVKGSDALKAILAEYGAGKVSEVPADKLGSLIERMEAL